MSARPKVSLAYLHEDSVSRSFQASLNNLVMWDAAHNGYLMHDSAEMPMRCGTGGLVAGRNQTVEAFLETKNDWLLVVDSDMGFLPDALDRLMATADPKERPIVGALCFASKERTPDGMGGFRVTPRPTIYTWREHEGAKRFLGVAYYPVNRVVKCDATGAAFILIHRSALKAIGGKWYDRLPGTDGSLLGEDISFCIRCGVANLPIHVHTGVRTTHHKPQWISELDWWANYIAPPATEETAVIVPVLRRPENAQPFMRSLRASTGLARVYAIATMDDEPTYQAWTKAGAEVLEIAELPFAVKANRGFKISHEPWAFITGDDVRFHPGWLDHAQHIAAMEDASVIGTNDLANPRVLAGDHATHYLIRRSYVEEQGGSWDGPGILAHEGYRHWFVDDEVVTAAKQRDVWAMALGSVVEHLHPIFGKGVDDEVYKLGQASAGEDKKIFRRRLRESRLERVSA